MPEIPEENLEHQKDFEEPIDLNENVQPSYNPTENKPSYNSEVILEESSLKESRSANALRYTTLDYTA